MMSRRAIEVGFGWAAQFEASNREAWILSSAPRPRTCTPTKALFAADYTSFIQTSERAGFWFTAWNHVLKRSCITFTAAPYWGLAAAS